MDIKYKIQCVIICYYISKLVNVFYKSIIKIQTLTCPGADVTVGVPDVCVCVPEDTFVVATAVV